MIEIAVPNPQFLAIADNQLRIGFGVFPAKLSGTGKLHRAAGFAAHFSGAIHYRLDKLRPQGFRAVDKIAQPVNAARLDVRGNGDHGDDTAKNFFQHGF